MRCAATHATLRTSVRIGGIKSALLVQVEVFPEGLFLATSDELRGLGAEALDIARDVARKVIGARRDRDGSPDTATVKSSVN